MNLRLPPTFRDLRWAAFGRLKKANHRLRYFQTHPLSKSNFHFEKRLKTKYREDFEKYFVFARKT